MFSSSSVFNPNGSNTPPPPPTFQDAEAAASSPSGDSDFLRDTAYIPAVIGDAAGDAHAAAPGAPGAPAGFVATVPPELIAQALGPSFQALFKAISSKRGSHWQLEEYEKNALISGWTPILQNLLSKLGSSEQLMFTLAMGSTVAIIGGKLAQDATKPVTKPGSSTANIRTREPAGSSASSGNAAPAKRPEPVSSLEEPDEL